MRIRLLLLLTGLSVIIGIAACASPTPAPTSAPTSAPVTQATVVAPTTAPTIAPTIPPTVAPTPTPALTSENCIKCHTNKDTLEKLAEKKVDKSEETAGEG